MGLSDTLRTLAPHVVTVALYWAVIFLLSSFMESHFTTATVWGEGRIMYMTIAGSIAMGTNVYIHGWMQENRLTKVSDETKGLRDAAGFAGRPPIA